MFILPYPIIHNSWTGFVVYYFYVATLFWINNVFNSTMYLIYTISSTQNIHNSADYSGHFGYSMFKYIQCLFIHNIHDVVNPQCPTWVDDRRPSRATA